jgi:hypothetical protein
MGIRLWIADMESDGVRFTDEQIEVMRQERESLLCNYSGLSSLINYTEEVGEKKD